MLFAIRHPAVLLGLVLGFAAGIALRSALAQAVGGVRGSWRQRLTVRSWLDPFGAVAAVLSGVGWGPRVELGRGRQQRLWWLAVLAVVVHAALAAAGFAAYVAAGGSRALLPYLSTADALHGSQALTVAFGQQVALGFGVVNLGCGLLSLLPIPPMETGVALWTSLPKSPGARRAAYHLLEEQWGVAALLVLLLLPLAGQQPAGLALVGAVGDRVLGAL